MKNIPFKKWLILFAVYVTFASGEEVKYDYKYAEAKNGILYLHNGTEPIFRYFTGKWEGVNMSLVKGFSYEKHTA